MLFWTMVVWTATLLLDCVTRFYDKDDGCGFSGCLPLMSSLVFITLWGFLIYSFVKG